MPRLKAHSAYKQFFKRKAQSDVSVDRDEDGTVVVKASATEDGFAGINLHRWSGSGKDRLLVRSIDGNDDGGTLSRFGNKRLLFDPGQDYQYLGAGETATAVFHARGFVFEGRGKWERVDIRIEIEVQGSNDAVNIDAQASTLVGLIDEGEAPEHAVAGDIRFSDPDVNDRHVFRSEPQGADYVGTLELEQTETGIRQWRFSAEPDEIDYLQVGDRLVQSYLVTIDDGNGSQDTTIVTVTIEGGNDAPVVDGVASVLTGAVTEMPDKSAGEGILDLTATGTLTFRDADLADTHQVQLIPRSDAYLGVLTLGSVTPISGTQISQVSWTFVVNDAALEDLDTGDSLLQFYNVVITDARGATVSETIAITLNGADDPINRAPVVTADTVKTTGDPVTVNLLANDIDPDGGPLSAAFQSASQDDADGDGFVATVISVVSDLFGQSVVLNVSNGQVSADVILSSDYSGNVQVSPGAGFDDLPANESIQFQLEYSVYDAFLSTPSTLNVELERINRDPVVQDRTEDILEDQTFEIQVSDLLASAVDPDGDPLVITTVSASAGSVELVQGRLVYRPPAEAVDLNAGESRTETVTYVVSDGDGGTATGTVEITINGVDDGPGVRLTSVAAGIGGFVVQGAPEDEAAGALVSSAGDVNGDGFDDLIVGGLVEDAVFVVFGKPDGGAVDLAEVRNGNGGFLVAEGVENIKYVSAAGDVNGDGLADIIVGRPEEAPNAADTTVIDWDNDLSLGEFDVDDLAISEDIARLFDLRTSSYGEVIPEDTRTGQAVVVFGKTDTGAVDLGSVAGGQGGFAINGYEFISGIGASVSSAGDMNGDGLDNLIVGATNAQAKEYGHFLQTILPQQLRSYESDRDVSGRTYVVYGKEDTSAVELESIDQGSSDGIAFDGLREDRVGWYVTSLGDVNGDGFDDVMVTASARVRDTQFGQTAASDSHAHAYVLFEGGRADKYGGAFGIRALRAALTVGDRFHGSDQQYRDRDVDRAATVRACGRGVE